MKISFDAKSPKSDAFVAFAVEGGKLLEPGKWADKKMSGALKRAIEAEKFEAKKAQTLVVPGPAGMPHSHVVIVGLGKPEDLKEQDFEKLGGTVVSVLNGRKAGSADVAFRTDGIKLKGLDPRHAAARMATGALLSAYRFDKYLTKEPKDKKPTLKSLSFTVDDPARVKKIFSDEKIAAESVYLVRDLVSEAPNVLYPESFAAIIRKELSPFGVDVTVLGAREIEKKGMGALMAVGQGSAREPKLVTMEYRGAGKKDPVVCFVGKGVTFDTGGISIKPGPGMEEMKWDMAGAAVVTGLLRTLAAREAKVNAVGVVALAENMPSGTACRPGDIVETMSGQTVEILNTDAEGRLILCDALWYAQEEFRPTHIVDLATLTGAMIIALGHEYAGVFSNDSAFVKELVAAGKHVGEELWRMPLNDAWDKAIDSPAADMKNISGGRDAGSAIGAHFLKRFIQDGVKWAHLDIAGVAWSNKDRTSVPKGASAFGMRLLDRYVAENWEK
ncbi:MAG: leucyl aminopeptidase [Alphaproteobacteria bacterium]|nr:MAG: leucyl aminopeptidase [Alphaproteobacteria bacterium]